MSAHPETAPACRCGHARGHAKVSAEAEYSALGWVAVVLGVSARPTCVRFRCRVCGAIFDETREPADLDAHG